MNTNDEKQFRANYLWFNRFFDDLQQLLETISKSLVNAFSWETDPKNWYYNKFRYQPAIPPYYMTALDGGTFAVQIYAVLDTTLMENQPALKNVLSLVIVKHSRPDRVLWLKDYGLRVIQNSQISQTWLNEKVISGEILAGGGEGTKFYAFQVLLNLFSEGQDVEAAIQTEIVDILRTLPDW